jgi:uncharacterized membrane protein
MVAGHNFLTMSMSVGITLLHSAGPCCMNRMLSTSPTTVSRLGYPLVPWIGVMALGYCCGGLYSKDLDVGRRKTLLILLGGSMVLAFVILRYFNLYGEASHWSKQASASFSLLSFPTTSQYPPSLLFLGRWWLSYV